MKLFKIFGEFYYEFFCSSLLKNKIFMILQESKQIQVTLSYYLINKKFNNLIINVNIT